MSARAPAPLPALGAAPPHTSATPARVATPSDNSIPSARKGHPRG